MIRGTTPTIVLTLPEDIDLSGATKAYLTIGQAGESVVNKDIDSLTLVANTATATLTQNDTLELEAGRMTQIQLRWLADGVAYATKIVTVPTDAILMDGVI